MKLLKFSSMMFLALSSILLLGSCEEDLGLCSPIFNSDSFLDELEDQFDGNVMGYAVVVTKDGTVINSRTAGKGIGGNDGDRNMSLDDRMHIASISKSITTITALKVLADKGVDINTPVGQYMPPTWSLGTGFNNVTFYELLHQSAGLNQVGTQGARATRFDSLQVYAAAGASQPKVRSYTNTHHGFMRIILPRLWDKYRPADGNYDEDFYISAYESCVQENLLDLLNINNGDCQPPANPNLAYSGPNDNSGSGSTVDFSDSSGGLGWNFSATEISKIWAYAFFTEQIISNEDRDFMMEEEMGLWNSTNGDKGRYLCKLGGWGYDTNNPADTFDSCLMHFPNGVQAAVIINSPTPGGQGLNSLVRNAFDDSWNCL